MQASDPTLQNRGRKAAENGLKIQPLANHPGAEAPEAGETESVTLIHHRGRRAEPADGDTAASALAASFDRTLFSKASIPPLEDASVASISNSSTIDQLTDFRNLRL
jgi:hypothetical protein